MSLQTARNVGPRTIPPSVSMVAWRKGRTSLTSKNSEAPARSTRPPRTAPMTGFPSTNVPFRLPNRDNVMVPRAVRSSYAGARAARRSRGSRCCSHGPTSTRTLPAQTRSRSAARHGRSGSRRERAPGPAWAVSNPEPSYPSRPPSSRVYARLQGHCRAGTCRARARSRPRDRKGNRADLFAGRAARTWLETCSHVTSGGEVT